MCRIAVAVGARAVLLENVPNMLLMRRGHFRNLITQALSESGFSDIAIRTLNAADYGVPQARQRVFILALRPEAARVPAIDALDVVAESLRADLCSVDEAIGDLPAEPAHDSLVSLPYPKVSRPTKFQREMRLDKSGSIYAQDVKRGQYSLSRGAIRLENHHTKDIQARRLALIKLLAPGAKADSLPVEVWNNARPEKWRRFDGSRPAHTLLAQMHRDLSEWVHPQLDRWITVREALRLQSFHDGFVLETSEWQQLKQVGNAVPPLLGRIPATAARIALTGESVASLGRRVRGQLSLFTSTSAPQLSER